MFLESGLGELSVEKLITGLLKAGLGERPKDLCNIIDSVLENLDIFVTVAVPLTNELSIDNKTAVLLALSSNADYLNDAAYVKGLGAKFADARYFDKTSDQIRSDLYEYRRGFTVRLAKK